MAAGALSFSSPNALFLSKPVAGRHQPPVISLLPRPPRFSSGLSFTCSSPALCFNPLRVPVELKGMATKRNGVRARASGAVCSAAILAPQNLQWIAAVSSLVLTLAKGTAIQKSFLVPFFALQAPASIISWMKSEYGAWAAFLALLVRLFFHIPGI